MSMNSGVIQQNDGTLYVDDFSRTQDIYLHCPLRGSLMVPRDMRRRATSNMKQPSYYGKKKSFLTKDAGVADVKLLELHSWNAKRMKMMQMWGWYLPFSDNQRVVGTALKHISKCATVHDSSYYEFFRVTGDITSISELFTIITVNHFKLDYNTIQSNQLVTIPLYTRNNDITTFIGPVKVLMEIQSVHSHSTSNVISALFFCHPCISDTFASILLQSANKQVQIHQQNDYCFLSIRGNRSWNVLKQLFSDFPFVEESLDDSQVISIPFLPLISSGPYYTPEYSHHAIHNVDIPIPQRIYRHPQDTVTESVFSKPLWSHLQDSDHSMITQCTENHSTLMNPSNRNETMFIPLNQSLICHIIRINPSKLGKCMNGYDILMSRSIIHQIWTLLCESHVFVIAQADWHAIHTCFGQSLFPYDFPDSPSGMSYSLMNYISPFHDINHLQINMNASRYAIVSVYRSIFQSISSILTLIPVERDPDLIRTVLPNPNRKDELVITRRCLIPVNIKVNGRGSIALPCSIRMASRVEVMNSVVNSLFSLETDSTIGFVTSFVWSPKASAFVALGFCVSHLLWTCLCEQGSRLNCVVVLVDETDKKSCLARLTVMDG